MIFRHLRHQGKRPWSCSRVPAFSCHLFHSRDELRGCPQSGTAWMCVTVASLGSQRCWFRKQFCANKRSWKFEERCTAILFGITLVMAAYAPDSGKGTEMYEASISSVLESAARRTSMLSRRPLHYRRSQCGMGVHVCR